MDIYEKLKAKWEGMDADQETCSVTINNTANIQHKIVADKIITSFSNQYGINHMLHIMRASSSSKSYMCIDAHGITSDILIKKMLDTFNQNSLTCKIITGHGSGILKSTLRSWICENAHYYSIIGMIEYQKTASFIISKAKNNINHADNR